MSEETPMDAAMLERLVRVETKLDMALSSHAQTDSQLRADLSKHENGTTVNVAAVRADVNTELGKLDARLSRVEKAMWIATGIAAAVGGAGGTLLSNVLGGP